MANEIMKAGDLKMFFSVEKSNCSINNTAPQNSNTNDSILKKLSGNMYMLCK